MEIIGSLHDDESTVGERVRLEDSHQIDTGSQVDARRKFERPETGQWVGNVELNHPSSHDIENLEVSRCAAGECQLEDEVARTCGVWANGSQLQVPENGNRHRTLGGQPFTGRGLAQTKSIRRPGKDGTVDE